MTQKRFFRLKWRSVFVGILLLLIIMVAIPFALQRNQSPLQPINQLYVFGDSLSDVGNVYNATNGAYPPSPPYFKGRYSNGEVWAEQLAKRLNLSQNQVKNFAWGGATTGRTGIGSVPGLLAQVDQFVQSQSSLNAQALYVLWAGANDYLYSGATPKGSIDNLTSAIQTLMQKGATRFLIGNVPDLGHLPATRNNANANVLSQAAIAHDQTLKTSLDTISKQSNIQLALLDVSKIYQDARANPGQFGFTNVTAAYLDTRSGSPNQFLFWDGIHPTTAAHKILGDQAFTIVQNQFAIRPE